MTNYSFLQNLKFSVFFLFISLFCVQFQSSGSQFWNFSHNKQQQEKDRYSDNRSTHENRENALLQYYKNGIAWSEFDNHQRKNLVSAFRRERIVINAFHEEYFIRSQYFLPYLKVKLKDAGKKAILQTTIHKIIQKLEISNHLPTDEIAKSLGLPHDTVKHGSEIFGASLTTQLRCSNWDENSYFDNAENVVMAFGNATFDTTLALYQNKLFRSSLARKFGLENFACQNPACTGLCEKCATNNNTAVQCEKVAGIVLIAFIRSFFGL